MQRTTFALAQMPRSSVRCGFSPQVIIKTHQTAPRTHLLFLVAFLDDAAAAVGSLKGVWPLAHTAAAPAADMAQRAARAAAGGRGIPWNDDLGRGACEWRLRQRMPIGAQGLNRP